jgi:hypothetical protein
MGTVNLSTHLVEANSVITALDGPQTYRFTSGVTAIIRISVEAGPGARNIRADLWNGMGWGYIAPIDDWQADWSVEYEAVFEPATYDIVVAPSGRTAGAIAVRVEILPANP